MSRHHHTFTSLARRLQPTSEDFAAAGAWQDPNLLLQLRATQSHGERPTSPQPSPTPLPRRSRVRSSIRRAARGETGTFDGALLDQAKVGILATALLAPALAVAALAPLRRRDNTAPVRRGPRLPAPAPCPAR